MRVVDVVSVEGERASRTQPPAAILEVPHGATEAEDFTALAGELDGPLPEGLVGFFHVNTDAGAPELALQVAIELVAARPAQRVVIVRSRVPRTFVDCNRRLDASAEELKAGKVTPGLMPWVHTGRDRSLLLERHAGYVAAVEAAAGEAMPTGFMLCLHTYAPRSVGVEVGMDVVASLRAAYRPEVEPTWPVRPPVDIISRTPDGRELAPPGVAERLDAVMAPLGHRVGRSETYPMHDSTLAYGYAVRWPGRVLCLEVRRDLLAEAFVPLEPVVISAERVRPFAVAIAGALLPELPGG